MSPLPTGNRKKKGEPPRLEFCVDSNKHINVHKHQAHALKHFCTFKLSNSCLPWMTGGGGILPSSYIVLIILSCSCCICNHAQKEFASYYNVGWWFFFLIFGFKSLFHHFLNLTTVSVFLHSLKIMFASHLFCLSSSTILSQTKARVPYVLPHSAEVYLAPYQMKIFPGISLLNHFLPCSVTAAHYHPFCTSDTTGVIRTPFLHFPIYKKLTSLLKWFS